MKSISIAITVVLLFSCAEKKARSAAAQTALPIMGNWRLLQGTTIENGDTIVTDYNQNQSFIKIINNSHFAFLQHDLRKGKDSAANFVAGGGTYTIKDGTYNEHLEYCSAREWEGNDFTFRVTINNDTLVQQGVEKVAGTGIDRINTEQYVRVKQ